ncbi:MAG TPA: hypothetical protein VG245_06845 [Candidatus Dormibacteraeota bacterium]|jgi:predicted transcriptional regulator|nr:hypothetical protein [Candidatus Dormibacteraeota bacterium]
MARIHVNLDDTLLRRLDGIVGVRGRTAYLDQAIREKLDRERRWEGIMAASGAAPDDGTHPWDGMPAAEWVARERAAGSKRDWTPGK